MRGRGRSNPGTDNAGWVRTDNFCSNLNQRAESNYHAKVGDGNYRIVGTSDLVPLMTFDFAGQPWACPQVQTEHLLLVYPRSRTILEDGSYEMVKALARERTVVAAGSEQLVVEVLARDEGKRCECEWACRSPPSDASFYASDAEDRLRSQWNAPSGAGYRIVKVDELSDSESPICIAKVMTHSTNWGNVRSIVEKTWSVDNRNATMFYLYTRTDPRALAKQRGDADMTYVASHN